MSMAPTASSDPLLARHPQLWTQGQRLLQAGQWQAAHDLFAQVAVEDPTNAAASLQLALILLSMRRIRDAHAMAIAVARLAPRTPDLVVPLARLLRDFEEASQLQQLSESDAWHDWGSADALFALARILFAAGLNEAALPIIARAEALDPRHVNAIYLRAATAMFQGREEDARQGFQRCLVLAPALAQAHWMLSVLDKRVRDPESIGRLQSHLRNAASSARDRAYLWYAMHNRLHTLAQYDGAWGALRQAWQAKGELLPYDRGRQVRLLASLTQACDHAFVSQPAAASDRPHARCIFIVGLHRSGTSLLERMLGGHSAVTEGGESYTFATSLKLAADYGTRELLDEELVRRAAHIDHAGVGERFRTLMDWRAAGRAYVTEKLPGNFLHLGYILRAVPDAIVLHMVRDPVDTCFSNLRTYFDEAAPYACDQLDMADYHQRYRALMGHWHEVAPGRILDVDYAGLVADPRAAIERVLQFCALAFEPGVLQVERAGGTVSTASMMDARLGIRKDRHDAWKPYEQHLAPLLAALAAGD